jgi:hypothetical protein
VRFNRALIAGSLGALIVVAIFAIIERGFFGPPVITIFNRSGSLLSDVSVAGEGFCQPMSDLSPGRCASVVVHPRAESGVKLVCRLADRKIETDNLSYIEASGGYAVIITVWQDGHVQCVDSPLGRFSWRRAL